MRSYPLIFIAFLAVLAGAGCAKQPPSVDLQSQLVGKTWVAEYILGQPVVDMSRSSIVFADDGSVTGIGGCNTYSGSYHIDGEVVTMGPLAATMRACTPAIGDQEMRFFLFLNQPLTVSFENGLLYLTPEEGKPSVFAVQN